jgi:hypothetical protein
MDESLRLLKLAKLLVVTLHSNSRYYDQRVEAQDIAGLRLVYTHSRWLSLQFDKHIRHFTTFI